MRIFAITMQRNEDHCLEPWIRHHGYIFGFENICILDHNSSSLRTRAILSKYSDLGIRVIELPSDAKFDDKGHIVFEQFQHMQSERTANFIFPIDCDELIFLKNEDGSLTANREKIYDYISQFHGFNGRLFIRENYLRILGHSGYFWPQSYAKVFFDADACLGFDHGFHIGHPKDENQSIDTRFVYAHFHFKPYEINKKLSLDKLRPYVNINDIDALRAHDGPGFHLKSHVLATKEEYEASFLLNNSAIFCSGINNHLSLIGIDPEFCDFEMPDIEPFVSDVIKDTSIVSLPKTVSSLSPCSDMIGRHHIRDGVPLLREFNNIICVPPSKQTPRAWGIFYENGALVEPTGFYRGDQAGRHLPMQEPVAAQALVDVPSMLPDEVYFYGGKIHPHYGHFILSTLSRFWPYASSTPPRLKILMHEETSVEQWFSVPHLAQSFAALGINQTDFINIREITKISRLLVADPAFIEEYEVYKMFADLGHFIGDRIAGPPIERIIRPVYLTKANVSSGVWRFVNEVELTDVLASHGFDIVCPEKLSFSEQIKLFRTRATIVGTMSSSLHSSIFSDCKPTIIGLNYNERARTNYTMVDDINGTSSSFYFPRDAVTDVGPSDTFTIQYRLNDPKSVAAAIVRLIQTRDTADDPIKIATRSLGLPWPLPPIGMGDFDWTSFEHPLKEDFLKKNIA